MNVLGEVDWTLDGYKDMVYAFSCVGSISMFELLDLYYYHDQCCFLYSKSLLYGSEIEI